MATPIRNTRLQEIADGDNQLRQRSPMFDQTDRWACAICLWLRGDADSRRHLSRRQPGKYTFYVSHSLTSGHGFSFSFSTSDLLTTTQFNLFSVLNATPRVRLTLKMFFSNRLFQRLFCITFKDQKQFTIVHQFVTTDYSQQLDII